jgi:hypothetical protein
VILNLTLTLFSLPKCPNLSKLTYIESWQCIQLANDTFGFNGWSSSIKALTQDFFSEGMSLVAAVCWCRLLGVPGWARRCLPSLNPFHPVLPHPDVDFNPTPPTPHHPTLPRHEGKDGKIKCGFSAIIRVELKDGTSHEDIGYGCADNIRVGVQSRIAALDIDSLFNKSTNPPNTPKLCVLYCLHCSDTHTTHTHTQNTHWLQICEKLLSYIDRDEWLMLSLSPSPFCFLHLPAISLSLSLVGQSQSS